MNTNSAQTSTIFPMFCVCLCGDVVTARDTGFEATTVTVDACSTLARDGFVSFEVRKSTAYAANEKYVDSL